METQGKFKLLMPSRNVRALSASATLPILARSPRPLLYKALARPVLPLCTERVRTRDILYAGSYTFPATTQIGERLWRVDVPFVVSIDDSLTHYEILIPPGWETDYGSVPRVFWNVIPPLGVYSAAYVLHDYCYEAELFDRATCDWLLLLMLQELGACWIERNTIYSAVRGFGWSVWRNHDPAHVHSARQLQRVCQLKLMASDNPYDLTFNSETKRYELRKEANHGV